MNARTFFKGSSKIHVSERSLTEFVDIFNKPMPYSGNEAIKGKAEVRYGGGAWYGGITSTAEATGLVRDGWREGAQRLGELGESLKNLVPEAKSYRRRVRWSEEGDELHVERAVRGDWDLAWRSTRRTEVRGPAVVEIAVSWANSGSVDAQEAFWTGAAALVVTDLLETAGYTVRICAYKINQHGYGNIGIHKIVVKEAGEPLQLDYLASLLCHVGVYRTYGFRTVMDVPFRVESGLGMPVSISAVRETLNAFDAGPESGTIVLDSVYTRDGAVNAIKHVVSTLQPE